MADLILRIQFYGSAILAVLFFFASITRHDWRFTRVAAGLFFLSRAISSVASQVYGLGGASVLPFYAVIALMHPVLIVALIVDLKRSSRK